MSATPGSGAAPEDEKKPNEQHINLKVKGQHPPHYLYVEEKMKESHQRAFDLPFICSRIVHPRQGKLSYYNPSCLMMDYIVHAINKTLSDSFYFKRANPDYHPYILRLYYGVMFWVQCLRAGNDVYALTNDQQQFLTWFLDYNPPKTLPIAGPLLGLFKTLCSSQPEFPHYGKVYPRIPTHPGPRRRDEFMRSSIECNFLPNVPGIYSLLEDLNQSFTSDPPIYPKLGRHIPVTENAAVLFGHKVFPVHDERTDAEKWSLVSPGLQYPCEADQKLNEMFSERYDDFDFPVTAAGDNLQKISSYLSLKRNFAWFFRVKEVANAAAAAFERSGTLADCFPHGLVANQIVVCISDPQTPPAAPTRVADAESLFDFGYRLKSTAQNLPPIAETAAAYAQTHIRMPNNHPYLGLFGTKTDAFGPFWSIRPIDSSSPSDDSSFLIIPSIVKRALKTK